MLLSLETAEHLPPERSESFVDDLCRLSDVIVFGAAIPNQHGLGHINERSASEWAQLFLRRNYTVFDIIRPVFWRETRIPVWYRQNMLLYINSALTETVKRLREVKSNMNFPLDLCHPDLYSFRINQYQEWLAQVNANAAPRGRGNGKSSNGDDGV